MTDIQPNPAATGSAPPNPPAAALEQGTYEVIRHRLATHGADLKARLNRLNQARQTVFGTVKTALLATERVTTKNKCSPRDIISLGRHRFLFGYNVQIGLRSETTLSDVFALYQAKDRQFHELPLDPLAAFPDFAEHFKTLYQYYRNTTFAKFSLIGPHLFMIFQVGKNLDDIKTFKWLLQDDRLTYLGNRSDHEFKFPPQHEFEWTRTHRELHRFGLHPHISIQDRLFVETIGGDLTIKLEDNTASGQGIYAEPVEQPDQTLDDAEIYFVALGSLILLKIRPYQEKHFRYLVYNEKLRSVQRIDAIQDACVLLPENHGIIFSSGYYLQTGEFKTFETALAGMKFDGRLPAPNGEDHLFRFYHPETGQYLLMSYNLIEQRVELPMTCGGCSIFENGDMALFKPETEPQKHHAIQIWQTPYATAAQPPALHKDSRLYKIGNPDLVTAMAECQEVLTLLAKDDTYADLYIDIVKKSTDVLDSWFWLGEEEAANLKAPLVEIRHAASSALEEFEKVVRIRRNTAAQIQTVTDKARDLLKNLPYGRLNQIDLFVHNLDALRAARGELISLKELRYADLPIIEAVEKEVASHTQRLSTLAVEFLLTEGALAPYQAEVARLQGSIKDLAKAADARNLEKEITRVAKELEMLIEVVGNLKIEDGTQSTSIIENISAIYSVLNQTRAVLKRRIKELHGAEAVGEFASQTRLLNQALINYLDLADTAPKCDEFLTRLMVRIEELESRFSDFEEFLLQLTDRRAEILKAFETRKVELLEAQNRKTNALWTAAERILKGIRHRVSQFQSLDQINGYYAADLMVEKVRDLVAQLTDLGDTVKADDLQSRLKTTREDAVRQLKDRQEIFVQGQNLLRLGKHHFSVNTQALELTIVHRDDDLWLHLAGTRYFDRIQDPALADTRSVWNQEVVSESPAVYRAEYLAWRLFQDLHETGQLEPAAQWPEPDRLARVQQFMGPRYTEGYVKGVHDVDAARILGALLELHATIGLLRYSASARACAAAFWRQFPEGPQKELLTAKLRGYGAMKQLFPSQKLQVTYRQELTTLVTSFLNHTNLFETALADQAAEYLYYEIKRARPFIISPEAAELFAKFRSHLNAHRFQEPFAKARAALQNDFPATLQMLRDWLRGYLTANDGSHLQEYLDETAVLLLDEELPRTAILNASVRRTLEPMFGNHPVIKDGKYDLHQIRFMSKMRDYDRETVPRFERCQTLKKELLARETEALRLSEFKPRVLSSFVRNRLIDSVYLPLIGDNLAKQIGVAGEQKRTDLMGMLLLISPPGYGKTTLMEYIADRLGVVFVKISGPAIGDKVTSLDPAEAPNAAAREEIQKLNLALEMGDNVMLYLDDIQHCNPEFLQKFISLCDAQRKIEGIYRGKSRTYDLRGRKVVVVMAGNPYTESGEKFRIPDMLANRADTYNLGDIIGNNAEAFHTSYLENAMTSNPVLAKIAARNPKDIYAIIRLAMDGERDGLELEGGYSAEELNQLVDVMKKMIRVRDVLLKVNAEYIYSAAQADAYRTEPPFKLQGSYRNMNRLAEKALPVMNDQEIDDLVQQHYKDEAQTLTQGAESNLLKLKELTGKLSPAEAARWQEIKRTFKKNLLLKTGDGQDPVGLIVGQLSAFGEGLDSIRTALETAAARPVEKPVTMILLPSSPAAPAKEPKPVEAKDRTIPAPTALPESDALREVSITPETLKKIWELVEQQNKPATGTGDDSAKP